MDQLQTAVSDQEKKIIAKQVELRRKQALARAAEAQEAGAQISSTCMCVYIYTICHIIYILMFIDSYKQKNPQS